jgi:hypothetical protein
MDLVKTFVKGRMNKSLDERLIPDGEYIDAMNVRVGSTELTDVGSLENTKGNVKISEILYNDGPLDVTATCIGAFQDGVNDTIYWFIHSPEDGVDMIVSMNVETGLTVYHVVSTSVLNFSRQHLINGVNKVEDLLFFTDGYNPPRKINVKRSYPSEPDLKESDISVIVAPPHEAPSIELININGEENYIEDKFLSFAYRYKYLDGEYSAISQFSEIAFEPGFFNFDFSTFENGGMKNKFNAVNVTFDTGGEDVVGIDLLFKNSVSSVINVIEKYDKRLLGLTNNSDHTVQFSSKKILTTLPESEILRLFDNVPLIAKAQTVMSNRIFYGNYKDGYDIIDSDGKEIDIVFNASLVSEELGYLEIPTSESSSVYGLIPPTPRPDTLVTIDLSGADLKEGGAIEINFTLNGVLISDEDEIGNNIIQSFYFEFQKDYSSVYELTTSQEFKDAIGSETFHETVADCGTANQGTSLTDIISCQATAPSGFSPYGYGINTLGEGIKITSTPGSSSFSLQMIVMVYEDDANPGTFDYEYFESVSTSAEYISQADASSLHSNRDFSLGIIYMDEFNRATTVLTSENNSIHIPAKNSVTKNSIKVDIFSNPPFWAKKYKFALLPSGLDYETIYSTLYFLNTDDGAIYLNLEGNNQNKAKVGDKLIVKRDSDGPVLDLIKCDVLDIVAQPLNFIEGGQEEPAGLYMKVYPVGFSIDTVLPSVWGGRTFSSNVLSPENPVYPFLSIPVCYKSATNEYIPFEVPEGSIVEFDFVLNRPDANEDTGQRKYTFNKKFTSTANYDSVYEFVLGQDIKFDTGISEETGDEVPNENIFIEALGTSYPTATGGVNKYQFFEKPLEVGESGSNLHFSIRSGTPSQGNLFWKAKSTITGSVRVVKQNAYIVFETEPTEPAPAIYYEGNQTFDIVDNEHSETSIVLNFSDCFTFANGVESYKIEDSLAAPYFRLGERVSSVSGQDFQLADRFSSLTYSGVFNPENNVNKLNEFNLGLANFKDLERRFGSIQKISGRQTDILVLQEDKISYVLAGKNVLSDAAAGGGAIAAIPEVLGNQVARIEEYGISLNPESYVEWGFDKYFTDQKRGAVIHLAGAGTSENLSVISNEGMRSWFRDLFINDGKTQKLGGYDPYMAEYVLSSNNIDIQQDTTTIGCGTEIQIRNGEDGLPNTIVELGEYEGLVSISVEIDGITPTQTIKVDFVYNGVTYTSGNIGTNHVFTFNKTSKDTGVLSVTQTADLASYRIIVGCPEVDSVTVISVTVNDKSYEGKVITDEYSVGTNTSGKIVSMLGGTANPIVSNYSSIFGPEGFGAIPSNGNTVVIRSVKGTSGTMQFNPSTHKLRYLMSNTLYTQANVLSLLNASTVASPVLNPSTGVYTASFTYNTGSNYLYIIHDYRNIYATDLCYSNVSAIDACCECVTEPS